MNITRRAALERMSAGALLAAGIWPGTLAAQSLAPNQPFKFIVVNDTHYLSPECGEFLEGIIRKMKADEPEFVIVAGDLTEHGKREDLGAMREILKGLDCPYYTVIGNHDYTPPDRNRYYKYFFPRRLNYWFEHRGWQFIGLDTSQGNKYEKTSVQPDTLQWLDDNLRKLDPKLPTVIHTHFPLGPGVRYRPTNADAVLERFREFNLQKIFCGHFHGFTEKKALNTIAYTNRCCALKRNNHDGTKEKGYFLCETTDKGVSVKFVQVEVPKVTPEKPTPKAGKS